MDKTTQLWVKLTGRKIDPKGAEWLTGPIGDADVIGDHFIHRLANNDNLEITESNPDYGLLESIADLGLSVDELQRLHPGIVRFYEKTSTYDFDFWSEWCGFFRPFGWLLSVLFSKRLQQLNLPLNPLDSARGLDSKIIKLKKGNQTIWTIWYRILKSTNRVIYSGIYTTCKPERYPAPLLKVIFPLPNGNASVIMTREVLKDGSLLLASDGKRFGDNGFYFLLSNRKGTLWAKYVRSIHEWIHVYVDQENCLRADHRLNFYSMRFLNLHYKMKEKTALHEFPDTHAQAVTSTVSKA